MENTATDNHPLKTLLQLHLGTESSTVLHLPYILQTLDPQAFTPSSVHSQRWATRINSLIYAKDSGARWAGLTLALRTSMLCKPIMIECAQSWVSVALPMISKNDALPCIKACIRLVCYVFTNAADVPEFQRQVATPNVAKFSQALLTLCDKKEDIQLKALCLTTLSRLVTIYPSPHRALHASLSSLSLKHLNGSTPKPSPKDLTQAASKLYSVLPLTGGKVGASTIWRKSVDETLVFTWSAFAALRTTFLLEMPQNQSLQELGDPVTYIPLSLDRLKCGIVVLCDLLQTTVPRPVQLPIGPLTKLCVALLSCSAEDKASEGYIDQTVRTMESSMIPTILSIGCEFLGCLAKCAQIHLTPHITRLLSCIAYQLEKPQVPRLPFLRVIPILLMHTLSSANNIIPNRLIKAVLPSLTSLLSSESDVKGQDNSNDTGTGRKKGKKRARNYEGDEVFKVAREVICPTDEDGDIVLAAVDATQMLLRDLGITPAVHSLTSRILFSLLLSLPRISPSALSNDLTLHGQLYAKVQDVCIEFGSGNASVMSKNLPLLIGTVLGESGDNTTKAAASAQRRLDLLLHPRLPPLVRSVPPVEALSLFRADENHEEVDLRKELGLGMVDDAYQTVNATPLMPPQPEQMEALSGVTQHPSTKEVHRTPLSNQPTSVPESDISFRQVLSRDLAPFSNERIENTSRLDDEGISTSRIDLLSPQPQMLVEQKKASDLKQADFPHDSIMRQVDDDEEIPNINMDSDSD